MKKLIVIALTLVMVFALSVPVFASSGQYVLSGKWVINDTIDCSSNITQENLDFTISTTFDNGTNSWAWVCQGTKLQVSKSTTAGGVIATGTWSRDGVSEGDAYGNVIVDKSGATRIYCTESIRTISFNGENVVSEAFYTWFTSNAKEQVVQPPEWDVDTYPFGFIMSFPQSMEIYFYAYDVRGQATATDGYFGVQGPANGVKYKYNFDSDTWSLISTLEVDNEWIQWDKDLTALYWTNYNVYTKGGDPFFMVTSVMTDFVRTASLGEVMKQVMMILPLCLVFLVGFVGLRKALVLLRTTLEQS